MKIEEFEKGNDFKTEVLKLLIAAIDEVLKHRSWETVFTTQTVDEFLFGYEDPLLRIVHDILKAVPNIKPDLIPNPIFAFSVSITCMWLTCMECCIIGFEFYLVD